MLLRTKVCDHFESAYPHKQEYSVNPSDEPQAEPQEPPQPIQPVPTEPHLAPACPAAQAPEPKAELSVSDFVDGQFRPLDPRNIAVQRISSLTQWAAFSLAIVTGVGYLFFTTPKIDLIFWIACVVGLTLVIATGLLSLLWPKIEYNRVSFKIDPVGIEIHEGVFWRSQICVPIGRVQHADVGQGPLQRMFGVSTLTLHTAGTSNASVAIEGLDHAFAVSVRDWIVHQRKNHDAV